MRSAPLLLVLLALAACASPEPLTLPEPPPVADVPAPEPALRPLPPPEPPAPPPPPAEAPRGSIEGRSVYPDPGIVEWRLANGMTVIYKHLMADEAPPGVATVEGYAPGGFEDLRTDAEETSRLARAVASARWGTVRGRLAARERRISGTTIGLRRLLDDVAAVFSQPPSVADPTSGWRDATDGPWGDPDAPLSDAEVTRATRDVFDQPEDVTLVVVGGATDEAAEALVGTILGPVRARRGRFAAVERDGDERLGGASERVASGGAAPVVQQLRVRADVRDAAPLAVLAAALAERTGTASVRHRLDPQAEIAELTFESDTGIDLTVLDRPLTEPEVARARRQALATGGDLARAEVWLGAIERHYREEGDYRPARHPREIGDLPQQIRTVSVEWANRLLARFRETPSRATLTSPR